MDREGPVIEVKSAGETLLAPAREVAPEVVRQLEEALSEEELSLAGLAEAFLEGSLEKTVFSPAPNSLEEFAFEKGKGAAEQDGDGFHKSLAKFLFGSLPKELGIDLDFSSC